MSKDEAARLESTDEDSPPAPSAESLWGLPIALLAVTLVALGILGYHAWLKQWIPAAPGSLSEAMALRAQFGDSFGAFNAIVSSLALVLVGISLVVQGRDLRVQLKELSHSVAAQEKAAAASEARIAILREQAEEEALTRRVARQPIFSVEVRSDGLLIENHGATIHDAWFRLYAAQGFRESPPFVNIARLRDSLAFHHEPVLPASGSASFMTNIGFSNDVSRYLVVHYRDALSERHLQSFSITGPVVFHREPSFRQTAVEVRLASDSLERDSVLLQGDALSEQPSRPLLVKALARFDEVEVERAEASIPRFGIDDALDAPAPERSLSSVTVIYAPASPGEE